MILRNNDRQTLLTIFSAVATPIEVWAYGSRVSGTAHSGSDLDLVVYTPGKKKLPIDVLLELKEKITESNIPIVVELFDWARLPESFHQNIEAQHEVLFSNISSTVNEPTAEYGLNPDLQDLPDWPDNEKNQENQINTTISETTIKAKAPSKKYPFKKVSGLW